MSELPREVRNRTPAPHALRIGLRRAELPSREEVGAFCGGEGASLESGDVWIRVTWGAARDTLLVLLVEGQGPEHLGFNHALIVESSHSKSCFLAAYFIARRCGGVVQIRQRDRGLAIGHPPKLAGHPASFERIR